MHEFRKPAEWVRVYSEQLSLYIWFGGGYFKRSISPCSFPHLILQYHSTKKGQIKVFFTKLKAKFSDPEICFNLRKM